MIVGSFGNGVFNQTGSVNYSFNGGLVVGGYDGGTGVYNQSAGTVAADTMFLSDCSGSTGTYNRNGGTLTTANIAGSFDGGTASTPGKAGGSGTGSGNVYVNTGAWLGGTGTIGGSVFLGNGAPPAATGALRPQLSFALSTLTPGDGTTPIATLTVNRNLTLTPGLSMTELDLGDPVSVGSDLVKVSGNPTIGGDLQLTLAAGFTPTLLQTFTLIDVTGTGTTTGTFENTTANGTLYTDANGDVFLVTYAANAHNGLLPNDVTATFLGVPEPSTWGTLLLGGAGLLGVARHRRCRRA